MDSSELRSSAINRKARKILHAAMQLKHTYEASVKEPVSPIQLARFQSNPNVHGPNMGAAVVELLAEVAKSTYPGISAKVHWRRLFTTRIDRIISDATHFRKVGISYEETRRKKVLKLALHRKLQRRFRTACIMLDHYTSLGDEDGIRFWTYILQSSNALASTGKCEETASDKECKVSFRGVTDSNSCHSASRILFHYVDDIPSIYPDLFDQRGKKRLGIPEPTTTTHMHVTSSPHPVLQEEHSWCLGSDDDNCPTSFLPYLVRNGYIN
ncbi:hypothetical protein C8J55DRAFT_554428 [Lentinula edodes]|uniref:Uncharacterized protein n=1 Tax=Lentinula lateritia TaxID=40482 RepID=A0A9W9B130_9AGAR|nr:hypothetical protein C8J55DRAFT_554428 [Lentinula edodes]